MVEIPVTIACGNYDRTEAIRDGRVKVEGCAVTYLPLYPEEIFHRVFKFQEFDISEMSFSSYIRTVAAGTSEYTAVPAFVSRIFRHSGIYIRKDAGITKPEDLRGKRIGVPEYQITAVVWMRGMMQHEYGVPPSEIHWRSGGQEQAGREERTPLKPIPGLDLQAIPHDKTLVGMLRDGELDALFTARAPSSFLAGEPHIVRLFSNTRAAEVAYYKKTGHFPIMHLIGIRKSLTEKYPWLATSVYKAFVEAKALAMINLRDVNALMVTLPWLEAETHETAAIMGEDFWKYGIAENKPDIEALTQYIHEQGLADRKVKVEELFHPAVFDISKSVSAMTDNDNRVIISGAGPVGAIMTLALVKKGIPVTLIEQLPDAAEDQRAATIHPPTVAMLVDLGLEKEMFSTAPTGGMEAPLFHFRDRATGKLIAVFDISLLKGEVPYPYVVQWEQYKLVHAALPYIKASGLGEVLFSTKLTGLSQTADHVDVAVTNADGESDELRGKYLIGADGGSSTVRRLAEIAFEGFTWPERFIKIGTSFDFGLTGQGYCTRNYFSDPDEWINLFKVKGKGPPGIWRGVFPVPENETDEDALSMAGIQRRLQGIHEKSGDYEIPYYALYAVHQRVAATFNKGRVLLAGDCAHVNNPIGGMGMNGGIHDAVNLAEKLADVWFGRADLSVLDRYTRQRRKAQVDYVQAQTIQNKKALEEKDPKVRWQHLDELRRTSEDVTLHKKFLYRSSLIDSLNSANAVE